MKMELLRTFLSDDGDVLARRKLLNIIRDQRVTRTSLIREFNFNRFTVLLDFEAKQVLLRDDLTIEPEGEYKLTLDEFERSLQGSSSYDH